MDIWIQIVLTALLTTLFLAVFVTYFYCTQVKPFLNQKVEDFRAISKEMEVNIRSGVRAGVNDAFKDLPGNTVKETKRSVVKLGSGLVEGGISSIFKGKRND